MNENSEHLLTFASLMQLWDTMTAKATQAGLTDQQAAEVVGAWLDSRLERERLERIKGPQRNATVIA
jgi:hypothetical protein